MHMMQFMHKPDFLIFSSSHSIRHWQSLTF